MLKTVTKCEFGSVLISVIILILVIKLLCSRTPKRDHVEMYCMYYDVVCDFVVSYLVKSVSASTLTSMRTFQLKQLVKGVQCTLIM